MKSIFIVIGLLFLAGCSDDGGGGDSTSLGTAGTIFSRASSAVSAGGASFTGVGSSLVQMGAQACAGQISDLSSDASGAAETLGCLLTTNSQSPDTVLGSFHLVSEVMNMLEQAISFTYGSDFTTHENISGNVTTSDGNQSVTVSIKERALSSTWSYHIQLCILSLDSSTLNTAISDCESSGFTFEVFLLDTATQLGFKTIQRFGTFQGGNAFLLDTSTAELRYEGWDEDNGRHARIYMQGAVSTSFVLDNITSAEVAIAEQGLEASSDGTDGIYAEFDGTNLCINTWDDDDNNHGNGAGNGTSDLTAQGTCSSHPNYDGGFFTASGLETFLTDTTKGILNFTTSTFAISSYFIDI